MPHLSRPTEDGSYRTSAPTNRSPRTAGYWEASCESIVSALGLSVVAFVFLSRYLFVNEPIVLLLCNSVLYRPGYQAYLGLGQGLECDKAG